MIKTVLKTAFAAGIVAAAAGCASSNSPMQAQIDQAMRKAESAQSTANEAQQTANQALQTANQAKSMAQAADERRRRRAGAGLPAAAARGAPPGTTRFAPRLTGTRWSLARSAPACGGPARTSPALTSPWSETYCSGRALATTGGARARAAPPPSSRTCWHGSCGPAIREKGQPPPL